MDSDEARKSATVAIPGPLPHIVKMKANYKIRILTLLTLLTLNSCVQTNKTDEMNTGIFESRIHTTEMEIDWYKFLGKTSLDKHLEDFDRINWKEDYWKEDENKTYNSPDLEVLNTTNSKYLSISVCPNTFDSYQFFIGYGTHKTDESQNQIYRTVKLYGTATDQKEDVKDFIRLFFTGNLTKLESRLEKLDFFEELEDVYQNIDR